MKLIALLLSAFCFPLFSHAAAGKKDSGLGVNLALYYATSKYDFTKANGSKGENKSLNYDFNLGYTMASGIYLGGIYGVIGEKTGSSDLSSAYMGASIGYRANGWELTGHYFLSAEYNLSSTSKVNSGNGFGVDLAYLCQLNSVFSIGPQLSYRHFNYTKYQSSGTESTQDNSKSYILPYIVLGLNF